MRLLLFSSGCVRPHSLCVGPAEAENGAEGPKINSCLTLEHPHPLQMLPCACCEHGLITLSPNNTDP